MNLSDINYIDISRGKAIKKKCAYCGNKYIHHKGHIEYKVNNKTFCCFDHKIKYIRKNNIDTRKAYRERQDYEG